MGLRLTRLVTWSVFFTVIGATTLFAAPKLRLDNTAFGPISLAAGANGPVQTVEARNAGDGALALTAVAPATWLNPVVGAPRNCSSGQGTCTPIHIDLLTAGLGAGKFTGTVEVLDPNAVDAPQTITVTVQMGGGVPASASLFVAPNGSSDSEMFETNSPLRFSVSTQSGGPWLSLSAEGAGSFDFVIPYRIRGRYLAGLGEGIYRGDINVTGSAFAPDVKNVPVTMRVTSQPIATASTDRLDFSLAADTVTLDQFIVLVNRGLSAASVTTVTPFTSDGGTWLAAELVAGTTTVKVTASGAGMAPGLYSGLVTVGSTAVNAPHVVEVWLTVTAQGPPAARYQGVVNNATFEPGPIAQGAIAALFGDQLSYQSPQQGTQLPLVTELGGTKVFVNGVESPLYFSSYGQINFQIPYETPEGEAQVQVMREGVAGNIVSIIVVRAAPRILTFLDNYAIAVNQDGTFPVPPVPGLPSRPARPGDILVIYSIGFGQTSPPVVSGEAAPGGPLAWVSPLPTVFLGGGLLRVPAIPAFVGLTPNFVGLYQINLQVPGNAPRGIAVPMVVEGPGYVSNHVSIAIE